ncbi:MAG: hypothetical protein F6K39_12440 [Okeania sp. SIO3B3]|nr:hypothetical protein [Okeania sp. SIO3B3]
MFVTIIGIKPRYLISLNPTAYSLLPTPYSQEDVARLLRFGIPYSLFPTMSKKSLFHAYV